MFLRNQFLKVDGKFNIESLEIDVEELCYFLSHSYEKEKYINEESNIILIS